MGSKPPDAPNVHALRQHWAVHCKLGHIIPPALAAGRTFFTKGGSFSLVELNVRPSFSSWLCRFSTTVTSLLIFCPAAHALVDLASLVWDSAR